MDNSGWVNVLDEPIPEGKTVFVLFAEMDTISNTCVGIHASRKTANGYLNVINGRFDFDWSISIIAWHYMDDLEMSIPLKFWEGTDGTTDS